MAAYMGIPLSKVSPAFLRANSTSHTWAFSAFAEIIDNAYDPDVSASELLIDKVDIHNVPCLIFLDNGAGMDRDQLLKMLSFGFCEKDIYEKQGSHQPIGHYGNGFKSGSMRLGMDALVFTRCLKGSSIGFLSQTFLAAIKSDSVVVPILEYRLPNLERIKSQESRNNLNAILQFSIFKTEKELKDELRSLEGSQTGTKIIIYNLKRLQDGNYELDFSSDPTDIRCPEAHEVDLTSVYHRPIQNNGSEYKRSLREYCSILFLRPRMKITIRGVRVKNKLISKSLSNTEIDTYKPTWLTRPVKIIFGFRCDKRQSDDHDYGMMLYHRNRLIKAYEKVGYQKQPNDLGVGVVGVAHVDFLQPIHNKQDFNKDEKFNSVMAAFANKLNDYWNEKKGSNEQSSQAVQRQLPDWLWVQCDQCLKWRRLLNEVDSDSLPDLWYCRMNQDATHNRCDIQEEPEDEDLAVKPTYEKTFKKKQEERRRLQQIEREKEEDSKRRKLQEKERELRKKEATLRSLQQVAAAQPETKTVVSLQKALSEARRREEQQKRMITQMQEQKRLIEEQRNSLMKLAESVQAASGHNSKAMLEQMSKLISNLSSNAVLASPALTGKRKSSEEETSVPEDKERKRICIQTETGEMLSITQNEVDSDDDGENNTEHLKSSSSPRKQSHGQKLSTSVIKSEQIKQTPSQSRVNSPPASSSKNASTKSMKQNASAAVSLQEAGGVAISSPETTTSSTRPKQKRQRKNAVAAVIDLTSECEFGELVDVKPDLDTLHTTLQENLLQNQADVKPDKDALDKAMTEIDESTKVKRKVKFLTGTKQEDVDHQLHDIPTAASTKESVFLSGEKEISDATKDSKKEIHFGPSEDDPEFGMSIPESFQENLEAAIAALPRRIENDRLELESGDNSEAETMGRTKAAKEKKIVENADDADSIDFVDDDSDYRDCSTLCGKGNSGDNNSDRKLCGLPRNRGDNSDCDIEEETSVKLNRAGSLLHKKLDTAKQTEMKDSFFEEPNSRDCTENKVEYELENRREVDSPSSLIRDGENVDRISLDDFMDERICSDKVRDNQVQMLASISSVQNDTQNPAESIQSSHNKCWGKGTDKSLQHSGATDEHPVHSGNSLSKSLVSDQSSFQTDHITDKNSRQSQNNSSFNLHGPHPLEDPILPMSPRQRSSPLSNIPHSVKNRGSSFDETGKMVVLPGQNGKAPVKVKNKQKPTPAMNECVLDKADSKGNHNQKHEQFVQTDLDMLSFSKIFSKQQDLGGGAILNNQQCSNPPSWSDNNGTSSQSLHLEKLFTSTEVQTQDITWANDQTSQKETLEELHLKLSLKGHLLEELEKKLTETHVNIHKLLSFIIPGTELGDASNIDQKVKEMIRLTDDLPQKSGSQDSAQLT